MSGRASGRTGGRADGRAGVRVGGRGGGRKGFCYDGPPRNWTHATQDPRFVDQDCSLQAVASR